MTSKYKPQNKDVAVSKNTSSRYIYYGSCRMQAIVQARKI